MGFLIFVLHLFKFHKAIVSAVGKTNCSVGDGIGFFPFAGDDGVAVFIDKSPFVFRFGDGGVSLGKILCRGIGFIEKFFAVF